MKLAVAIKTFMRDDQLLHCLDSIDQYLRGAKIYIADDSRIEGYKKQRYETLKSFGHKIIRLPFNVGLSAGRNALVDAIKEPYLLYCDDDFIITPNNGVKRVLSVLTSRPDIGMITGLLTCSGVPTGFERQIGEWEGVGDIPIMRTERGLNFFLARTKMFKDVKWNPKYKIEKEHEDFFRRAIKTKWKIYYCPQLRAEHDIRQPTGEYYNYRRKNEKG